MSKLDAFKHTLLETKPFTQCMMIIAIVSAIAACGGGGTMGGEDDDDNDNGGGGLMPQTSHNAGTDCMSSGCHERGNPDNTVFQMAGTVFRSGGAAQGNATVRVYLHGTNTLVAEMDTDASGNFYTTDTVDGLSTGDGTLVQGVNVVVEGANETRDMPGTLTSGSCGICHGQSNGRIVVN